MHPLQASTSGRQAPEPAAWAPCGGRAAWQAPARCGHRAHVAHVVVTPRQPARGGWAVRCAGSLEPPAEPAAAPAEAVPPELDAETMKKAEEFKQLNKQIEETASELKERLEGTSIYLVGMMGSGKSTVGKLVARALGYPFLDADQIAEQHAGQKISEIFRDESEEEFRELESAVLQELMPFKSCVIATGGGAVTRRKNWGFMQHGIVVWLEGPPELLARRACSEDLGSRPLLAQDAGEQTPASGDEEQIEATRQKLAALLEQRREQYAQADLTVPLGDADGNPMGAPVSVVAFRLLRALNSRLQRDKKFEPGTPPKKEAKEAKDFKGFGQQR